MAQTRFDLIVLGGGIHGLTIALHAARAGQAVLLLERDRIGGGATAGWFGILHGGLRYLQNADVRRFRASLADSRWFLRAFPDLVAPQPFLMPLYNRGLHRPAVFRGAFLADRTLGPDRNRRVPPGKALPAGRVVSRDAVLRACPAIPAKGLTGGALWHEAVVADRAALTAAMRDRALAAGVAIREGCAVAEIEVRGRSVAGLRLDGAQVAAERIVNATGAWSMDLAQRFDPTLRAPLAFPALAFNLLLDQPMPAGVGLSVAPPDDPKSMLFLYPVAGRTFAGTAYLPVRGQTAGLPAAAQGDLRARLDAALPGAGLGDAPLAEVTQGLLPVARPGTTDLLRHDILHDHGAQGGPRGLITLWGVKFTTAPSVARRILRMFRAG